MKLDVEKRYFVKKELFLFYEKTISKQKTYINIANRIIRAPISANKFHDPCLNFAAILDIL